MDKRLVLSSCAAALFSLTVAAAQTSNQTPTQSPVQGSTQGITGQTRTGTGPQGGNQVTVTGCVVRESEHTNARGGVLGTGVGSANEFVLANAMADRSGSAASAQIADGVSGSTSAGNRTATGETATGTSGSRTTTTPSTMRGGLAYSLTGSREGDLAQHVGKRVQIVGTVDSSIRPSITVAPAQGESAANLQRLTIVSFRPVEGTCQ
jgi:hypothetical protein